MQTTRIQECGHHGRFVLCAGGACDEVGQRDEAGNPPCFDGQIPQRDRGRKDEAGEEQEDDEREQARGTAAGSCRAAEVSTGMEKRRESKEKQEKLKGKGLGEKKKTEEEKGEEREEEKEKEEPEEERPGRERWRFIELKHRVSEQQKEQELSELEREQRLKLAGPSSKKVKEEPWRGLEDVGQARTSPDGSGYRSGCGRGRWAVRRCSNDQLLQSYASPISFNNEPRHEGALPAGYSNRPAPSREAGCIRGCTGEQIHCHTNRYERRQLEIGSVSGDASIGPSYTGPSASPPGGPQTCEVGGQEPRYRGSPRRKRKLEIPRKESMAKRRMDKGQRQKGKTSKRKRSRPWSMESATRWLGLPPVQPQLVGGEKGGQRECRQRRRQKEGWREGQVKEAFSAAGSVTRAGMGSRLEPGLDELAWVAGVASDLKRLGVALAWLFIMSEYESSISGSIGALMAVVQGRFAGNGAVQRALSRSPFPLPLGGLEALFSTLALCSKADLLTAENVQRW